MITKKTKIMFERHLNDTQPPVQVKRGWETKHMMLYGVWLRKFHYDDFVKQYEEWKKESC